MPQLFGFQSRIWLLASLQLTFRNSLEMGKNSAVFHRTEVLAVLLHQQNYFLPNDKFLKVLFLEMRSSSGQKDFEKEVHFRVCAWEYPVLSEAQASSGHNSSSSKALQLMD